MGWSDGYAEAAATIYSITESCRRLGVDPHAYLVDLFDNLATVTDPEEYRDLTPARWAEKQDAQHCGS